MDDKSLGYTIIIITLTSMVGYLVWAFPGLFGGLFCWVSAYSDWAVKLPVFLAVYMVLGIVFWIGYTMATTPPPIPLEMDLDDQD